MNLRRVPRVYVNHVWRKSDQAPQVYDVTLIVGHAGGTQVIYSKVSLPALTGELGGGGGERSGEDLSGRMGTTGLKQLK